MVLLIHEFIFFNLMKKKNIFTEIYHRNVFSKNIHENRRGNSKELKENLGYD
jgi:hypothetical protein